MDLKNFFNPKTIAVIGASREPEKVGHVLFKNLLESKKKRKVIPINPSANKILDEQAFPSVMKVKDKIDLAVVYVPAKFVLKVVEECHKKRIKNLVIVSAGFSETGDKDTETKLRDFLNKNKMMAVGVNCLGIYDAHNALDALFIPKYRMKRPEAGGISFVCQSGAIGLAIMDIATEKNYKFAKFISYGNATQLDESDFLRYLADDRNTKVICLYLEGVKDGEKFFKTAMEVSKKKPIVVVKGGLTEEGKKATVSHTGSLAGKKEVYYGVFDQTNLITADNLEEMFYIASILDKGMKFKGNRVQIVTNGGGYGIVTTDQIASSKDLKLAKMSKETASSLRKLMPDYVNIGNPLDIVGDATSDRYRKALSVVMQEKDADIVLLIALYQTPLISTDVVEIISEARRNSSKPLITISTGSEFTENLSESLQEHGVPVFSFPHSAVSAVDKVVRYKRKLKR